MPRRKRTRTPSPKKRQLDEHRFVNNRWQYPVTISLDEFYDLSGLSEDEALRIFEKHKPDLVDVGGRTRITVESALSLIDYLRRHGLIGTSASASDPSDDGSDL